MAMGKGAIIGILGGILVLVGCVLPWLSVSYTLLGVPLSISLSGFGIWQGLLALIFGILGLIMAVLRKKVTSILALVFGILALLMIVLAMMEIGAVTAQYQLLGYAGISIGMGFGIYIALIGAILLMAGGGIGMMEAGKAPAPMMPPPPMMPAPPPS